MNHVDSIIEAEQLINNNLAQACKELVDQQETGCLTYEGIIWQARDKIKWLAHKTEIVESMIHNAAIRSIAQTISKDGKVTCTFANLTPEQADTLACWYEGQGEQSAQEWFDLKHQCLMLIAWVALCALMHTAM